MPMTHHSPSKNIHHLFLLLSLLFSSTLLSAQTEIEVEPEPAAETEIICYAAMKKWVCAPADEKQQAHEKAMKLLEQQPSAVDSGNNQVEIKTMDLNTDFSQQVQESPAENTSQQSLIDQQVKDFQPRADEQEIIDVAAPESPNLAEPVSTVAAESANQTPVSTNNFKQNPDSTPLSNSTAADSNDFSVWQSNHSQQWSFQVVGTSNQHHLNQFIIDNNLQKLTHTTVKTQVNGADWWIILVGLYDSRDQALNQRDQLPAQLSSQAWVRQINTIEGE